MGTTHEKERTLTKQIGREVETALPGVEVLAVELSSPERFTVFVDHAEGVDHALCARVTDVLREYLRDYAIDVSSPSRSRLRSWANASPAGVSQARCSSSPGSWRWAPHRPAMCQTA